MEHRVERAIWENDFDFDYEFDIGADECDCAEEFKLPGRRYCANKACGSRTEWLRGGFHVDSPCVKCGCKETILRNEKGKWIRWSKWVKIQADKRDAEYQEFLAREYGFIPSDWWR